MAGSRFSKMSTASAIRPASSATANVYCLGEEDLHYGEHLIRQALRSWSGPKDKLLIATKAGLARPGGAEALDHCRTLRSWVEAS